MTRYEFLMETFDFFNAHPDKRGVIMDKDGDGNPIVMGCQYKVGDNACAIGRKLPEGKYRPEMDMDCWSAPTVARRCPDISNLSYDDEDRAFLGDIQVFHDTMVNWDYNGITDIGMSDFDRIVNTYIL